MRSQYLSKLEMPDQPGVYIFRDKRRRPLYIGRATSLKDRVKSYFSNDLIEARGPRIVDMVTKAAYLTWQETDSVLEAVILESNLIKKYQPFYNVDERDDKSSQYVVITDEQWPRVYLARARDFEHDLNENKDAVGRYFGPYTESGLIKEALKILRKLFPFRDKKAHDPRHESFYRSLGRSPQTSDANARRRYLRTISYLVLFFEGKKGKLRAKIEKDMRLVAKQMRFEEADRSKRLLYALDHINDIALIKRESGSVGKHAPSFRIEAYDIAHLGGSDVVGAMTVSVDGHAINSEYRRFKVTREKNDDAAALTEVLYRRLNHSEWTYPDLIVVDGNDIQVNAAKSVLKARRINIPVAGVTKDERHKAVDIIGDRLAINAQRDTIIAANAEAHRFAIAYHRQRRSGRFEQGFR